MPQRPGAAGLTGRRAAAQFQAVPLVDEGSTLVGEGSTLVGEGSTLVGEGLPLVGEGSTLVGEGSTLVGEDSSLHDSDKAWPDTTRHFGPQAQPNHLRPCFHADPASFLVALCDQLQEYGRASYSLVTDPLRQGVLADEVRLCLVRPVSAVAVDFDNGRARISYEYATPDATGPFATAVQACEKANREALSKVFGPQGWLDPTGFVQGFDLA